MINTECKWNICTEPKLEMYGWELQRVAVFVVNKGFFYTDIMSET